MVEAQQMIWSMRGGPGVFADACLSWLAGALVYKSAGRLMTRTTSGAERVSTPVGGQLKLEAIALGIQVRGGGHICALHDCKVVAQLGALIHPQPLLIHLSIRLAVLLRPAMC